MGVEDEVSVSVGIIETKNCINYRQKSQRISVILLEGSDSIQRSLQLKIESVSFQIP